MKRFPVGSRRRIQIGGNGIEVLVLLARFALADLFDFSIHKSFRQIMAARITAGAAIVIGEHLFNRRDAGVFFHVEDVGEKDDKQSEDDG